MNTSLVDQIVETVLYEGYILYPYRPSATKNRQRFTFGRVYPAAYSAAQAGAELCAMQTECLVRRGAGAAAVEVTVRFLHPVAREIVKRGTVVPSLDVDGALYQSWQEVVEQCVTIAPHALGAAPGSIQFSFPGFAATEPIHNTRNEHAGYIVRQQETISGFVEIASKPIDDFVSKLTVRILNDTPLDDEVLGNADLVLMRTLIATHTLARATGCEFLSLTDPPAAYAAVAANCRNVGTWPVLVGDETKRDCDTLLSSPIILPDYPKIAPESAGSLFDGTEIDELLTLRILTLTDDEKREMRNVDAHARRLLERTETMPGEHLLQMHGTRRSVCSLEEQIFGTSTQLPGFTAGGVYLQTGDSVRIRPKARADILDLALEGKAAVIEAVEQDAEGKIHVAVVLRDDPGRDLGLLRQPGHRFFYGVDEIEPLQEAT